MAIKHICWKDYQTFFKKYDQSEDFGLTFKETGIRYEMSCNGSIRLAAFSAALSVGLLIIS